MKIIEDVHANVEQYKKFIEDEEESIQLGDFGFKEEYDWFEQNIDGNKHKILFGNHDYYPYVNKNYSLGNWKYLKEKDIFCIRGAKSIDAKSRRYGIDLFHNEELTYLDFKKCVKEFVEEKPGIVISHDCPITLKRIIIENDHFGDSITNQGLEECFLQHQPYVWIFGHHHKSFRRKIGKTLFICLGILDTYQL